MTIGRGVAVLAPIVISGILFFILSKYGALSATVAWASPALGVMAAALVAHSLVYAGSGRDALRVLAGVAAVAASLVGFHALWRVMAYLWRGAIAADAAQSPFGALSQFSSVALAVWQAHWVSISFWFALALLPLLAALALIVPVVRPLLNGTREVADGPWRGAWLSKARLRELTHNAEGLPLGLLDGAICRFRANPARGWKGGHSLVISGTRGGKGVSAVIPAIIDHIGPCAVIDIKGELYAMTHRHRESLGRKVILLDPFGITNGISNKYNPLTFVRDDPRFMAGDIAVISEALVRKETGDGEHFAENARNLVAAAIQTVMRLEEPDGRTLQAVSRALFAPGILERLQGWQDNPDAVGIDVAETAGMLLSLGEKERGSFFSTLRRGFAWSASDPMRNFLSGSDFSFDDFFEDTIDLFVAIPLHQLQTQTVFMRLVVNTLLATVMREAGRRQLKRDVLLVLDEFVRLGRMEKIFDIATAANGLGIQALFIVQDRSQVDDVYGEKGANSLFAACATTRAWGLGRGDSATAEWLARLVGDRTVETASRHLKNSSGDNRSEQRTPFLSASEILEMRHDEMLVLFDGQRPAKLKRIISYGHKAYRDKLDPNPTLRL